MSRPEGGCGKLCYGSARAARRAHGSAHYRVRVYFCRECRAHHVTNHEKGDKRMTHGKAHGRKHHGRTAAPKHRPDWSREELLGRRIVYGAKPLVVIGFVRRENATYAECEVVDRPDRRRRTKLVQPAKLLEAAR